VHSHIQESFRSGPSPVAASATSSPVKVSPDTGLGLRSPQAGFSPSNPLKRLTMGAALLGCALACTDKASARPYTLSFGTISNFSVTATSGSTTGSYSIAGPSTGFYSYLTITGGAGTGLAAAYNLGGSPSADLVGFSIYNNGVANTSGGALGSFTMNFTASVLFYDYLNLTVGPTSDSPTSWTVTGLGSITDGQSFSPGSYTFNFVTTHPGLSDEVSGAAVFLPVPETSLSGLPLWTAGLFLAARSLRQRRSRLQTASSVIAAD
jgi:hypothetical protein